jgi:hypothetical protein
MREAGSKWGLSVVSPVRLAVAGALCGLLGACAPSPEEVYADMGLAAAVGDRKGFLAAFTPESQQLVASQISLTEAYGLERDNPVTLLVFPTVDSVEEVGDGEVVLNVSGRGNKPKQILFVKTDEGWRIDLKKLAKLWHPKPGNG